MKRKAKYHKDLPRRMYSYFSGYSEAVGAPSFTKFARLSGYTVEELRAFRKRREFDAAWRECNEIRRDYLIDQALCKRHDASFTKFIYALEYPELEVGDEAVRLKLEVLED